MNKLVYKIFIRVLLLLPAVLVSACSDVDSEDLRSSGFYASMPLTANGNNQTNVRVCLSTSSDLFADEIDLSDGDDLTATAGGITKPLSRGVCYENSFDFDEGGTEFIISLDREVGNDMPNSNVILPEKFTILMPDEGEIFNTGESITATWSPVVDSGEIHVTYSGDCIDKNDGAETHFGIGFVIEDTGVHAVEVDRVLDIFGSHSDFNKNISCPAKVEIERKNTGTVDPNYGKGGVITAAQIRSVNIWINP